MMPNIKIQRAGPDEPGHRFEFLPAADLGVSLTPSADLCKLGIPETCCVR